MERHIYPIKIYYEDTDAGGIVYHANYLRFMDRARTEWLRAAGALHDAETSFVVSKATVDYLKPARLFDELEVLTRISRAKPASLEVEHVVRFVGKADIKLCKAIVTIVNVSQDLRPIRLSEEFLERIKCIPNLL